MARKSGSNVALRKSEATRARILDAAAQILRKNGYSGTRLVDIAKLAGMQTGSLYYHFASREELVDALMDMGVRRAELAVTSKLNELPADTDFATRIRIAMKTHVMVVLEQENISSATIKLLWQVPPRIRRRQIETHRRYGVFWRELLREARKAGAIRSDVDLSIVRMAMIGALNWSADWYKQKGRASADQVANEISDFLLRGITSEPCSGSALKR